MHAATLSWLLTVLVSGTLRTGVPDARPSGCEPWPTCAIESAAGKVASGWRDIGGGDQVGPAVVAGRAPWAASIVRRRDPVERFPRALPELARRAVALPDSGHGLFEYSDGYMTRLDIHRVASYATLPLFLAQVVIGEVLLRNVGDQPEWAKVAHGPLAGALAGLFVVNTVTGGLNLLEARRDPNVESRTLIHSMLMLIADAGFVWTGLTVSKAGTVAPNGRVRTTHRKVALIAMGVATTGYLIMIPPFRQY